MSCISGVTVCGERIALRRNCLSENTVKSSPSKKQSSISEARPLGFFTHGNCCQMGDPNNERQELLFTKFPSLTVNARKTNRKLSSRVPLVNAKYPCMNCKKDISSSSFSSVTSPPLAQNALKIFLHANLFSCTIFNLFEILMKLRFLFPPLISLKQANKNTNCLWVSISL